MTSPAEISPSTRPSSLRRTAFALTIFSGLALVALQPAQAQSYSVLHSFSGGQDGANPLAGLSMDRRGNLYGTASLGGIGYGTVYELTHHGAGWVLNPLYQFQGAPDGYYPEARVIIASDGTLYGTTFYGGSSHEACRQGDVDSCGIVFRLRPPATACTTALCLWTETQVHVFNPGQSGSDFFFPGLGDLTFDPVGNLYGTAFQFCIGGGDGGVFQLTPSGGDWMESAIYCFHNNANDGAAPLSGVLLDSLGNFYGTTFGESGQGNVPYGSVYELTPSGSGWTVTDLHLFQNGSDGSFPQADLVMDSAGNLYGTATNGGSGGGGTVFELTPSQGGWTFNVLYSFSGPPGRGPYSPLLLDAAGNLYGTTLAGGAFQQGAVFKLTNSNGSWSYTSLHDFSGGSDGRSPYGHLIFDGNGNLYGTAGWGGGTGNGVAWEITP